ncbi:MAG: type II secretion system F family protein [Candidatus Omnitrophica bacterium]|nr:type II secretion system F family protein [Candidatus Omnitrophota bacterium]
MQILVILGLIAASIILIGSQLLPIFLQRASNLHTQKVTEAEKQLDKMFIQVNRQKLILWYTVTPLIMGLAGFFFFRNLGLALLTGAVSFIFPSLIIKNLKAKRRALFQNQLADGIMVLSSSLKGGLSLMQAMEVVVEEMPAPFSQEFGLVLRENKIGVPLEESLKHLHERLHFEELDLVINSMLVSKETGGDLTKVLARLSVTLRDNRKLKESIKTLTLQGRLQGIIMSVLPFFFVAWVVSFNRNHFDIMFNSETGRVLLIIAVCLQVVGIFLIHKFSKIDI